MWCREVDNEWNRCSFTQEETEYMLLELTEWEKIKLWIIQEDWWNDWSEYWYINSLLLDRYNKWKEERKMVKYNNTLLSCQMIDVSDWDNSYMIPWVLKNRFIECLDKKPNDDTSDEFYDYCDSFDEEWWEYKI